MNIKESSYKNPFLNRNADTDSIEEIVKYWCEPIHIELSKMKHSKKAVFIIGPRGCGKTTIFKYFSYDAQSLIYNDPVYFLDGGIYTGSYYRLGEFNYSAMIGKGLSEAIWTNIFEHTFELKLAKTIISTMSDFTKRLSSNYISCNKFIEEIRKINGFGNVNNINDVIESISNLIGDVKEFIKKRSMEDINFSPENWYSNYDLIGLFIEAFNKSLSSNLIYKSALMIDEVENISPSQQKVINTYVKFVTEKISFRIGSRPSGLKTLETLTKEQLRIEHDYSVIDLNKIRYINDYQKFLMTIANKRLKNSIYSKEREVKIEDLLGKKEDLSKEIRSKVGHNFKKHFKLLKFKLTAEELKKISNSDKLKELLNVIKINRGESVDYVSEQMNDFILNTNKSGKAFKKYTNDFVNKYKRSLVFLLLFLAGKEKDYYSLSTYAFLSSGSARVFLQLCNKLFDIVLYRNPDLLYSNKKIDESLQTKAAKLVAEGEVNYTMSIGPEGMAIYNFVDNICKLFRFYHIDEKLQFPETNQFAFSENLECEMTTLLSEASKHSIIIEKPFSQKIAPNNSKNKLYTINRIYFPLYNVSCVTRGGVNPAISDELMKIYSKAQYSLISVHKLYLDSRKNRSANDNEERSIVKISLFDFGLKVDEND